MAQIRNQGCQGKTIMDSFEFSKIAGAVLSALLLIFGFKTILDIRMQNHATAEHANAGYTLPAPGAPAKGEQAGNGAAAGAGTFDAAKVIAMIGAAKPENGEAVFARCATCHVKDKTAKSGVAPNLWGVVGRKRASQPDFSKYSEAMKGKSGEWSYQDLANFIHNPKGWLTGTLMNFPGIKDGAEIADLLAYLRTQSDAPAPLP
jgi:cytochrome c